MKLKWGFALALAMGLFAVPAHAAQPAKPAAAAPNAEQAIRSNLEHELAAFNRGDFKGYLRNFFPRVRYNELLIERSQLVDMNQELKEAFPNLKMRYRKVHVNPMGTDQASATTVAEFSGTTANYQGSGLSASYHEEGMITTLFQKAGDSWATRQLQVAWTDSYIDIGDDFGLMGFSTLPTLVGTEQPYNLRLYVGHTANPGVKVRYAYVMAPLSSIIDEADAEKVFRNLDYREVPGGGVNAELEAPSKEGTYVHMLVVDKYWSHGEDEVPLGQKVYSRMVRVE